MGSLKTSDRIGNSILTSGGTKTLRKGQKKGRPAAGGVRAARAVGWTEKKGRTQMKNGTLSRYLVTDKSFYKRMLLLMLPVVLQSMINQGVNMMDTVMVGKLGEISISASSLANQFYQIYTFLCMGLGAAGLVLASQFWGGGQKAAIQKVFDLVLQLVAGLGVVFAAVSFLFPVQILSVYTNDAEVIRAGADYLRVTAFVYLPHGVGLILAHLIRSIGNTRLGLIVSVISFFVNIGGNYIFIFGKLGMPALGLTGAAVGTLCARAVEFFVCIFYVLKVENTLQYRFSGIFRRPQAALFREFVRLGLPAVISDTLLGLSSSVISVILGHMGREIVSSYAIVMVLDRMCSVATMGIASAAGIMVGQAVGKGDLQRAHREGRSFLVLSMFLGAVSASLVLLVGTWSVGLYEIAESTRAITLSMMRASAIIVLFQTTQTTTTKGVLRGGGDTRFLMVADVIFQWCASIPLGYLAGIVLRLPPFWVLLALRIDYVIKAIWMSFRLQGTKWIHRVENV